MTNMRTKKFTRKIKVSLDEETYQKARELADALTYGNVSELIRQLIKTAYAHDRGDKA
jgi:Arc/MetJ-type ribon-helix-helix transcriptional regulator